MVFGKRTYKPNSVQDLFIGPRAVIPLGAALPRTLISDLPGGFGNCLSDPIDEDLSPGPPLEPPGRIGQMRGASLALGSHFPPYLVLLRVGFTLPPSLLPERCALTAPFHPYPGGLAVQANLKSPSGGPSEKGVAEAVFFLWHWPSARLEANIPDVIRHTALPEFGLSSPGNPARATISGSDRPVLLPVFSLP